MDSMLPKSEPPLQVNCCNPQIPKPGLTLLPLSWSFLRRERALREPLQEIIPAHDKISIDFSGATRYTSRLNLNTHWQFQKIHEQQ
jgi:hypothetical protein